MSSSDAKPTLSQEPVYKALVDVAGSMFLADLEGVLRARGFRFSKGKIKYDLQSLRRMGLVESYSSLTITSGKTLWRAVKMPVRVLA